MSKVKATAPAVEAEHTADPVRLAREVQTYQQREPRREDFDRDEFGFAGSYAAYCNAWNEWASQYILAAPILAAEVIRLSEQREAAHRVLEPLTKREQLKVELSDIRVGDRVIEGRHDGMVTRIMAGTPYRQIGPYAMVEWGNGAYTSTPVANLTLVARAVYMTPQRKSVLLHAYNEMRGEAFELERKGDVLSAQECWNDCEEFKFMLIEAGLDDAALNFANNTLTEAT